MSNKIQIGDTIRIQDGKNIYNNRIGLVTGVQGLDLAITLIHEGYERVTLVKQKNVCLIPYIGETPADDFTDGPWCVRVGSYSSELFGSHTGFHITSAKMPIRTICDITLNNAVGVPTHIRRANANLIAAAPDMLAALKELTQSFEFCGVVITNKSQQIAFDKALAAIQKATQTK